jgi:hypothetical protein
MTSKFDFIIVNLKVIGQTPRNRRLRMTSKGSFTLEDDHLLVPFKRRLFGDGREKLVKDVTFLLDETAGQIRLLLSSRYITDSDESASAAHSVDRRDVVNQLESIYRELSRSIRGFLNLKSTYESDKLMVGELELVVDKIEKFKSDITRKLPYLVVNDHEIFPIQTE